MGRWAAQGHTVRVGIKEVTAVATVQIKKK